MLRGYKYILIPNNKQKTLLNKHFGSCRFVYNLALETKNYAYQAQKKSLSYYDLAGQLPDLKKECEWLKEVDSQALQQSLMNMDKAFKNFFKKDASFPKYKSKNKHQSFRSPHPKNITIEDGRIFIPKFPDGIRITIDRQFKGEIRSATFSKTPTGKYYVSVLVETNIPIPIKKPITESTAIGIDLGLKDFIITSDGIKVNNPRYLRASIERLNILQRRMKNKKKGSNNSKKAYKRIAVVYERIAFQRKDFLHKLSSELVKNHDTLCMEDLNIKGMSSRCKTTQDESGKYLANGQSAKSGLNKSIQDSDSEHWNYIMQAIRHKFGSRFLEVFHQISTSHSKFTVYLSPIKPNIQPFFVETKKQKK